MRALNKTATNILTKILDGVREPGDSKKIDNAQGVFMTLCVECVADGHYSIAHYCNHNGDVMRDPEIIVWRAPDGSYIPYYFRNDTFVNQWQTYRTRQDRSLALETPAHTYDKPGSYQIVVKVVDIFGNDTSHLVKWEVK